jgi:integrase
MTKINPQNEKIKRKYFDWLKEAEGLSVSSIYKVERSIALWDDFTDAADYRSFNIDITKDFKKWLFERKNQATNQPISLTTCHYYLISLNDFFKWLAGQQGYKSKVRLDEVAYLQLDKKQKKMALNPARKRQPTLEIIKRVVDAIEIKTEVDRRDRALICWTLLSGMRDQAIATFPLGCFNPEKRQAHQDPEKGVKTKFSKDILTTLIVFDSAFLEIILDWVNYLRTVKYFTDEQPMFPATKTEQEGADSCSFVGEKVEPIFWKTTNSIRAIFKKRFEAAGFDYFSPHSFRHLAINAALRLCSSPAEFKAVSQNFGHENIATTMFDYASLPDDEVENKVKNLTEKSKDADNVQQIVEALSEKFNFTPKQT